MSIFKVNDIQLFYEEKGDPKSDKVIAFFNGVMASTNSWNLLWPIFVQLGYRVILHDFKGQLNSDKPKGPYTFDAHCYEADRLFDFLEVKTLHIIGTSYGGEIAMKYAMNYPERVKSITVIDSVSELDAVIINFVKGWSKLCDLYDGPTFFNGMLPSIYGANYLNENQAYLAQRANAMKEIQNDYFDGQKILYDTFLNEVEMTSDLYKIKCPSLIICGEDDLLKRPKFSRIIAENIDQSELIFIPDCGHVAIFEKPEELKSIILGFIIKNDLLK